MMKRTNSLIGFVLFLLVMSCVLFEPREPQTMKRIEHDIITAVIDSMMNTRDTLIVFALSDSTINPETFRYKIEKDSIPIDTTLYARFETANQIRGALVGDRLPDYVTLKSAVDSSKYSSTVSFSRPGISRDGCTAIIEYRWMAWPGTEAKQATLLEKQNDIWEIVWRRQMLIFEVY